jgi:hypothetical protein
MTAPVPAVPEPLWTLPGRPEFCPVCGDSWVRYTWRNGDPLERIACRACGWAEERLPVLEIAYRGVPLDGTAADLHRAVDLLEADTVPESYWRKVKASEVERARLRVIQGGRRDGRSHRRA